MARPIEAWELRRRGLSDDAIKELLAMVVEGCDREITKLGVVKKWLSGETLDPRNMARDIRAMAEFQNSHPPYALTN